MLFQERLRKYRTEAGYKSAKDFADELGIPYPSYMAYENKQREPKYDVLMKMADKLGVTMDELLGCDPKQSAEEQTGFDKRAIGERIKEYRVARGLTQSDLANKANITRIALGNYERGQRIPTIDIFARIAMALNVSIDELIGYRPEQSSVWRCGITEPIMTFKDNLKKVRELSGLTRVEIAKRLNMTPAAYGAYELGKREPKFDKLCEIADLLHTSIDDLLGYKPGQLSAIQQIKHDFANAGYELKEEGSTWWRYEITEPGEEYPFHIKTEDDLKQIYQQIKCDVLHAQKKVWKDNIYKSLLKYERRKYHEK